jgi:hypothetical protein
MKKLTLPWAVALVFCALFVFSIQEYRLYKIKRDVTEAKEFVVELKAAMKNAFSLADEIWKQ